MSWSVFIFAYNEEGTIEQVIEQTVTVLREIAGKFSVLVIDDGSVDGTFSVAQKAAQRHGEVQLLRHPINLGIGPTLTDGYQNCRGDVVCGLPADGEFAVDSLRDAAKALAEADVVCFHRDGRRSVWLRRLLTSFHRSLNRWLLGLQVRDVNWVKVYRRWVLDSVQLRSRSPLIETELLAHARRCNARIVEIASPHRVRERQGGAGLSGTLCNGVRMTLELLKLSFRLRFSPSQLTPTKDCRS